MRCPGGSVSALQARLYSLFYHTHTQARFQIFSSGKLHNCLLDVHPSFLVTQIPLAVLLNLSALLRATERRFRRSNLNSYRSTSDC